jgi:hypothetical protein
MSRDRFRGTAETLASLIAKHIDGPKCLSYDDDYKKARVQGPLIVKNKGLFEAVHQLSPSLAFTKTVTRVHLKLQLFINGLENIATILEARDPRQEIGCIDAISHQYGLPGLVADSIDALNFLPWVSGLPICCDDISPADCGSCFI